MIKGDIWRGNGAYAERFSTTKNRLVTRAFIKVRKNINDANESHFNSLIRLVDLYGQLVSEPKELKEEIKRLLINKTKSWKKKQA